MRASLLRTPLRTGVVLLLGCGVTLWGCGDSPVEFRDRRPLQPLGIYVHWFEEVATCMEREEEATPARFERIEWYVAEEIRDNRLGPHQKIWGNWIAPHEITIRSDALLDRLTVTHELVHDFLQTTGHDSPAFEECTSPCLEGTCDT